MFYTSSKNHRMIRKFITKIVNKRSYKRADNYDSDSPIIKCITEQVNTCNSISNYLSLITTKKILSNATDYTYEALDNMLTITSLMEESLCNKSVLD